ncbi:DNA recombination protein RmuC [Gordonia sp. NPDC003425]
MLLTVCALIAGLVLGVVIGWLANASRSAAAVSAARADAAAVRASQELAARSLSSASEDAARRQSTAIGSHVTHIVEPLRAVLGQLSDELRRVEHNRISAYSSLTEQVRGMQTASVRLGDQTQALANALHTPHVRGRWGELQLERVVELAGMTKHCDFSTQVSAHSDLTGDVRPDLVVHLAGGRSIVVDAKVPLHAYLDATESTDPAAADALLADHARALRTHIATLSGKSYWTAFDDAPEFVVLFVPGDAVLEAAARADPGLIEFAFAQNVVVCTPTSLIALLRTVALGWRHDAMTADAAVIHQLGVELFHRLESVLAHLDRVGGSLRRAVEAYNSTVGVIDTRVGVTARRLASLDALGDLAEPAVPDMIDATVRVAARSGTHAETRESGTSTPVDTTAHPTSASG